jgi:hypothetical protein
MHKLSFLIVWIVWTFTGLAQTPHGEGFRIDCSTCHTAQGWKVNKSNMSFDHNKTQFKLTGQHQQVDCKSCHQTLKFKDAKSDCASCHSDMHNNTLGPDCARCHDTKSWIIKNTGSMHQMSRFPLQGNHAIVDCAACHKSSSNLQFEPLGIDCINCHQKDYQATKTPNHQQAGYSVNCSECHGVKATGWTASSFEHGFFPLTAGHAINCSECHTNGSYQKISDECVSCHQKDFSSTIKPNHQQTGFSTKCKDCHTTNPGWSPTNFRQHDVSYFPIFSGAHKGEWNKCTDCHTTNSYTTFSCVDCHEHRKPKMDSDHDNISGYTYRSISCYSCHPQGNKSGSFNHNNTSFPLTGAHIKTDCASCHVNTVAGTSAECNACHQKNYTEAQTPNHTKAGLPVDCKTCHTTTAWQPSLFKHGSTGFELTGGHATVAQCSSCHLGSVTTTKSECVSCHQVQYNNAKGHITSKFPTDCKQCHNSVNWSQATFDHNTTNYPLTGAHVKATCASCHKTSYIGTSNECKSCHQTDFTKAVNPNHTKAGLPLDCKTCHTTTAWQPSSFKHSTTGFELTGGHAAVVQCSSCHIGSVTTTSPDCISCHQAQYNNAKGHVASKFPTDCKMCHNSTNWVQTTFNHNTTNFPLTGAHTTVLCASCHTTGYAGTSTECKACHQKNYTAAQLPNHTKAGLPLDCKTCHTTTAWQPSSFKHSTTGFELTGGHAAVVQCSSCHIGSVTTTRPDCISCHQAQYNNAKGHVASKFPTDCKMCHNSTNWLQTTFNHSTTNFPLTGAHTTVLCASCHTTGYAGTSTECKACHQKNYTAAQLPNHTAAGLPFDCKTCHTTTAWQPSSFKHSTTGFELTGGHAAVVQCSSCHIGSVTTTSPECISCHQAQYNNAKGHVASKFPTDCKMCHNSTNWLQTTFNHSTTNFPLTGAHTTVLCASCHTSGYAGTSTECKACHQKNYTAAQLPNHTAAGLPFDCKTCHTTTAWQPSSFKHSTTGFELTGGHAAVVQCSSCHIGSVTTTSPECISCHQAQYNNAKGHVASKFPTDCKMCHNSTNWLQTTFNHSTTNFPLTGAHTTVLCASCHTSGYAGTSTECKACHQKNYTAAQLPNHTAAGLPLDCKTCHTTTAWQPSSFKHSTTGFELTGGHAAVVQCSSCHIGSVTTTSPECITCHQAQYNNAKGHVASKFPTDCKMCHNSTNWLQTTFNHSTTNFPLTGAHTTVLCASCHTSGYTGTPTQCNSCHTTDYNSSTNPNHKTLALPVTCADCHTTNAGWQPATFAIHNNYYALTGAHSLIAKNCTACHNGNYISTPKTCYGCHTTDYKNTTNPAHLAAQFPTECSSCHTTTAWAPSTFNHDSQHFPIYSGRHKGKWTKCSECHTSPTNFALFSCIICHEHSSKTNVDGHHSGVNGYTYTGTSCYSCHPRGN